MKKKLNGKLVLSRETIRALEEWNLGHARGGAPSDACPTGQNTDSCDVTCGTCDSCFSRKITACC